MQPKSSQKEAILKKQGMRLTIVQEKKVCLMICSLNNMTDYELSIKNSIITALVNLADLRSSHL